MSCLKVTKRFLFLLLFSSFSSIAIAQDIQFSQFYATPLYINPAFAGSEHNIRFTAHSRWQWPGLGAKFNTYLFSVDNYYAEYNSSVGFMIINDRQGGGFLNTTEAIGQYSFEIPITRSSTLRLGIQGAVASQDIDLSGLNFPSQFADVGQVDFGNPYGTEEQRMFGKFGSGVLYYSNRFWGSFSVHNINTPNRAFFDQAVNELPRKYSIVGGYKLPLKHNKHGIHHDHSHEMSLIPTVNFKSQGKADQLDLGIYSIYKYTIGGLWYRGIPMKQYAPNLHNHESVVILFGAKFRGLAFRYSYDIIVSKLSAANPGGAHELNLTYVFDKHKIHQRKKPMKRLPCPTL